MNEKIILFLEKTCNPFIFPIFEALFDEVSMKESGQIEKPNYLNVKERDRF